MVLKIVDSHFHMWDPQVQDLPWLDASNPIAKKFDISSLEAEYAKYPDVEFVGGVYVEIDCADPEQEDRLLHENKSPKLLAKMLRSRVSPFMRVPVNADGVREPLHTDQAPKGRCLEPEFLAGIRALAAHDLPFEVVNRGPEIGDIYDAFSQIPEERIIIDHLGNVPSLDPEYKEALTKLSKLPNAYIKVSGDNPVDPDVVKFVRDTFGPKKCLWSSNFPVVLMNNTFEAHFELVRSIFGDDEDFFMNNAVRAYGIQL